MSVVPHLAFHSPVWLALLLAGCARAECDDWCTAKASAWDACRGDLAEAGIILECFDDLEAARLEGVSDRHECDDAADVVASCGALVDYRESTGLHGEELTAVCLPSDPAEEDATRAADCDALVEALVNQ